MKKPTRNRGLTKAIITNAAAANPLGPIALADQLGVEVATIHQLMARLRRQGRLPASTRQVRRPQALSELIGEDEPSPILEDTWVAEQLAQIEGGAVLTDQQILQVLSRLGLKESGGTVQVQALAKLREYSAAATGTVGPPEPLTENARVDRLARLLKGVGIVTARTAWMTAFPRSSSPPSQEEVPDAPQAHEESQDKGPSGSGD